MKIYAIEYQFKEDFTNDKEMHYIIIQANTMDEAEELFRLSDLPHDGCIVITEFNTLEKIKAALSLISKAKNEL
ncbi:MAG: hypothetical protein ACI4MQ_04010 [Candidatus Coproplasma sp.]